MNSFNALAHNYRKRLIASGLVLFVAMFPFSNNAFSATESVANTVEKIYITADRMQMNIESGTSVYTGNVKISQGELVLTGDKVTLESKDEELERLTVIGRPARYHHIAENGDSIDAESEHMVYTASQNKLVMTINAHLTQPDNKLSSQKITYDTEKKTVIAGDGSSTSFNDEDREQKQRVNIILTPKKPSTAAPQP